MLPKIQLASSTVRDLSFDETNRARNLFMKYCEKITKPFEVRTILSEMGLYPRDEQIVLVLNMLGNKMSFNEFCNYLVFLKVRFLLPEPADVDTLRAFVALGGGQDRQGNINVDDLRSACQRFELTIDIEKMIREVDEDGSGEVCYSEFKTMWDVAEPESPPDATSAIFDRRRSTLKVDAELSLDDEEDNVAILRQYLFPQERIAAVLHAVAQRKKSMAGQSFLAGSNSFCKVAMVAVPSLLIGGTSNQVMERERISVVEDPQQQVPKLGTFCFRAPSPKVLGNLPNIKIKTTSPRFVDPPLRLVPAPWATNNKLFPPYTPRRPCQAPPLARSITSRR